MGEGMNDVYDDIRWAYNIIDGKNAFKVRDSYHNHSFIYKFSNENVNSYFKYLMNRNQVLEVISSGDQILNTILAGSYNIDAFDISCFPKYFLNLKLAAIRSLTREEFIDFFVNDNYLFDDYYDDLFDLIKVNLDNNDKMFWDRLFNFYDWSNIYNSLLFSSETYSLGKVINNNKYLTDDSFLLLKDLIPKINLNTYTCDISDLVSKLGCSYDLVNLSNIIYYMDLDKYGKLINNVPLTTDGVVISYIYKDKDRFNNVFSSNNSFYDNYYDGTGVYVYKK